MWNAPGMTEKPQVRGRVARRALRLPVLHPLNALAALLRKEPWEAALQFSASVSPLFNHNAAIVSLCANLGIGAAHAEDFVTIVPGAFTSAADIVFADDGSVL